ncbi:MAG: hypothetical protein HY902_12750 [Deltaproteobacteria bacterium]|nr:hypothetical protein [Deltaproteobacteria bacterium]
MQLRRARQIGWVLVALAAACSSPAAPAAKCLPGLQLCQGNHVLLCLETGDFAVKQACGADQTCQSGECQGQLFGGDGGSLDATAKDGATSDTKPAADVADAATAKDTKAETSQVDAKDADTDTAPDRKVDGAADAADSANADAADGEVADAVAVDDATADAEPADAAGPDALADTPDTAADGPDTALDPFAPGILMYERLGNLAAKDDLRRVAWHPSGKFALLLGTQGQVLRWDAGQPSIAAVTKLGKDVVDLAADPAGAFYLVLGKNTAGTAQLWRGAVDAAGQVVFTAQTGTLTGEPVAVAAEPGGVRIVVATRQANPGITYLSLWQDGSGLGKTKAFSSGAGITDLMWTGKGLPGLAGSQAVITAHGVNGADSRTWVLDSDDVLGNGWSPGFGNAGGAGWRPAGEFGVVTGWSSNVVYVFDGAWQSTYLPGVNNGASPQAVGWKGDGTRALVVGRATGSPLAATVIELQAGLATSYSAQDWVNQSIGGFDKAPWVGNFNTFLLDVAWRPGGLCDEGIIVGSDTGASGSPTYGLAIRFYDSADPACAPGP